jgi:hypothetical protein
VLPLSSEDGDPMWSKEDPVHPLYNGYKAIIDLIEQEADSLRTGKKRPGGDIAPPAKKPRAELTRPRWVDQAETPVVMHRGHPPSRGRPWFRAEASAEAGSDEPAEAAVAEDTSNPSCRHTHCDVNFLYFFSS